MQTTIHGSPSFAYLEVELAPGESIIAESDAMDRRCEVEGLNQHCDEW